MKRLLRQLAAFALRAGIALGMALAIALHRLSEML